LHKILHAFSIKPDEMETIHAVSKDPKWKPIHHIHIPGNAEEALNQLGNISDDILIYTDGSSIDRGVGAAAVMYKNGQVTKTLHKHLGPNSKHTVFEAEIAGAIMGVDMAKRARADIGRTIALDNQAVIQSTTVAKQMSGQYLIQSLQRELSDSVL
jgi:hypothetical protein